MKTKSIWAASIFLALVLLSPLARATDITATNSGNWSNTNIWNSGTVPGTNDDADVPEGITVTVDTNVTIQFIYDSGTVTMAPNSTLIVTTDSSISPDTTLLATAPGCTVMYTCNPYDALVCNYYNLILNNTNWTPPVSPYYSHWENFNNFFSASVSQATPMTIYGNMTLMGYVEVQEANVAGVPININGNLTIGPGCGWDCSSGSLTVRSNLYLYGMFEDLDAANGSNYIGGNVIICGPGTVGENYPGGAYTNGWYVGDATTWGIGGSLTNNGAIYGIGYGSIFFNGTGTIAGSNIITIPTITIDGTYTIADSLVLTTNNANLLGTVIFDLANTNQIYLQYSATGLQTQTNCYGGNLVVVDTGTPPTSGKSYQLFNAAHYAGAFAHETLPGLAGGLSWVDNLATRGSIAVAGSAGAPVLAVSKNGSVLTLSWDSGTYPGYSVQAQTNSSGLGSQWAPTGSGTTSPVNVTLNSTNPAVFFRLSNP
jgi:hypothetical protein